jgi:hypothetical protein
LAGATAVVGLCALVPMCCVLGQSTHPVAAILGIEVTMPGASHAGPLPPLTDEQTRMKDGLERDLTRLAGEIGERNTRRPIAYAEAMRFVEGRLAAAGQDVSRQTYDVKGRPCSNLVVEMVGKAKADEIVVIGAHYDSAPGTPGANDNGSGTVALLALADLLREFKPDRTLRFVAFCNEEPPHFQTDAMGSLVYAKACKDRGDKVIAMLALETMGYYRDKPGSQHYPLPFSWFYPTTGNFIAFIGDGPSMDLVKDGVGSFRRHAAFPCEGGAVPRSVEGAGWSDHWSFWQCGYPGVMVTDTAPFRYPHYHRPTDTPNRIDEERLARVVVGLRDVIVDLCTCPAP